MTSLSYSCQKTEGEDQQCSVICNNTERSKSETNQSVHIYQYETNIYTLKPSESRKEPREIKFKHPGSANCQHSDDFISDGINQGGDINRPITRKRYATTKHSFTHTKESLKGTLNICKTILYPVGCNISSGYKHIRKWIKYELAKTHMYSWARCCGMPGV